MLKYLLKRVLFMVPTLIAVSIVAFILIQLPPGDAATSLAAQMSAQGETVDWDEVFANYSAQVDWPGARYWRELVDHFSDAKVILSVRDPDAWFDSVQATIVPFLAARGKHPASLVNRIAEMGHETVAVQLFDDRLSDRDHAIGVFRKHVAEVQSEVPAERLLTFDPGEGWEPLCAFLGVDVPDIPFPKTNSSKQFKDEEW